MPIRILRPTLRQSERWNRCSYMEQSFYVRLVTLADDYGRYDGHAALLASEAFPYGDDMGLPVLRNVVDGMLRALAGKDLLFVYEKDGKQFIQLQRWHERIRLKTSSRFPDPKGCKIVWKCETDGWRVTDTCPALVGGDFEGESEENNGNMQNDRHVPVTCQSRADRNALPTPTPTPTPTPGAASGNGKPTLEHALKWLAGVKKSGADYTEQETRSAFLALSAGGWMWGKNPVADYRAAIERQIQTDRNHHNGKSSQTNRGNPAKGFDRAKGTHNEGAAKSYDLTKIQENRKIRDAERAGAGKVS